MLTIFFSGAKDRHGNPAVPNITWEKFSYVWQSDHANQALCLLDSCDSGLAGLKDKVELLGASGWGAVASADPSKSFTRMLVDCLQAHGGKEVTAAQIISWITYKCQLALRTAQPIHRRAEDENEPSAIFHKIVPVGSPQPREAAGGDRAQILMKITLQDASTIPNARQWKNWLIQNIPPNIKSIEIRDAWQTASVAVQVVIPFEIWCS